MTSDRQIAANRRNARRSTGPQTAEGRAISSRNAERHGVLSERVVSDMENSELYDEMLSALIAEYRPIGETETLLIERLANLFWRERRLIQAERAELDMPAGDPNALVFGASSFLPLGQQLLIGRYQTMLTNKISSTISQIEKLQSKDSREM